MPLLGNINFEKLPYLPERLPQFIRPCSEIYAISDSVREENILLWFEKNILIFTLLDGIVFPLRVAQWEKSQLYGGDLLFVQQIIEQMIPLRNKATTAVLPW